MKFLHYFKSAINNIEIPSKFTFPFYYTPHILSELAAKEVQKHIQNQTNLNHNFGLDDNKEGLEIGKMFGVLVVQTPNDEIGYLAAFSGKLAGTNDHDFFVPPVFDMLTKNSYFLAEEEKINQINKSIENLEQNKDYIELIHKYEDLKTSVFNQIQDKKEELKKNKINRDNIRKKLDIQEIENKKEIINELSNQSIKEKIELKQMTFSLNQQINKLSSDIKEFTEQINLLKEKRKILSNELQKYLFDQYKFHDKDLKTKSLLSIFKDTIFETPPAGAGECAAPKLLHYAFSNHLKPIAMAEFWWGKSPKSEMKIHKQYYPACKGKCEPILAHMLNGIELEENPMLTYENEIDEIPIIYEDDFLFLVNKPAEFLSVPGKSILDSVYTRMKQKFPKATGPLIVHRLDMSTSGIMVLAKDLETYKNLQQQFIQRKVKKQYLAILEGLTNLNSGKIELPLRLDIEDRPKQIVCFEYGKHALTFWEKIEENDQFTKVRFYPETGRTHQLRVHAANSQGLGLPIKGDDLYGKKANRLHLHAEKITFKHPITKEIMEFVAKCEF